MACDNHLSGGVEIDRLYDLALRSFAASIDDHSVIAAHDRRHCADAGCYGLLHRFRAKAHQRDSVAQLHRARCDERGVFTQTVPGYDRRLRPSRRKPCAPYRNVGGQHRRLGVARQVERFGRTLRDQRPQIVAESIRCFGKARAHIGMRREIIQHADLL